MPSPQPARLLCKHAARTSVLPPSGCSPCRDIIPVDVCSRRRGPSLVPLVSRALAARQDTVDFLHQFTDEQLEAMVPSVVGEGIVGDIFAGRAEHAVEHMTSVEEGLHQGIRGV